MITGQIERKSSFEKAPPIGEIEIDGEYIKDSIKDDQAVVMNLKGKGLVIVSGCAHSGIINTILYAQKLIYKVLYFENQIKHVNTTTLLIKLG